MTTTSAIYLDYAATTPVDPEVFEAMLPWLKDQFGNSSSIHQYGTRARVALEDARQSVAERLGVTLPEVVFTSGGTEGNNAAIQGLAFHARKRGKTHIITSRAEHNAVLQPIAFLESQGWTVSWLTPDSDGVIRADQVRDAIREETGFVSLMHVNNELGSVNPIEEITRICREADVPIHCDAVQSAGKLDIGSWDDAVRPDLMSLSAHKLYGPKGVGALIVHKDADWEPWMKGGSQERNRRGGTVNVPGVVGLQRALELATDRQENDRAHIVAIREAILDGIRTRFGSMVRLNSPAEGGLPHILNLRVACSSEDPIDGEMLLLNLDIEGICLSNGSACTSGAVEPSHVLTTIGLEPHEANASMRVSLGRINRLDDAKSFVDALERVLQRMKRTIPG
ncbi:MAG: cysteine desulfurase family protein [Balneolaceae bacterium]